jgi:hypothetical protein
MKLQNLWLKWRILAIALPFTLIFALAKWATHELGWQVWSFDALTSSMFGAATLLLAFVLGGTLSDYRDSEVLPIEIGCAIEAMVENVLVVASLHADYDAKPYLSDLIKTLSKILDWLKQDNETEPVLQQVSDLNQHQIAIAKYDNPAAVNFAQIEQDKLRQAILKIQIVRDTNFVAPAYAILELFIGAAIVSLLLIGGDILIKSLVLSSFLFTAFIYLLILIRDLDNPFQYKGSSSADISLMTLEATLERLRDRLNHLHIDIANQ